MNPAFLMRVRLDYIQNKNDLNAVEYRDVIERLVLEIERLGAENTVYRIKNGENRYYN